MLKLQTDIANAVASALKVTLLGDVAAKIEIGGTRNPAAFDAYLRASNAYRRFGPVNLAAGGLNEEGLQSAIAAYTEAITRIPATPVTASNDIGALAAMMFARAFEPALLTRADCGFQLLSSGQEAVAVGLAAALLPHDQLLCSGRSIAPALARGLDIGERQIAQSPLHHLVFPDLCPQQRKYRRARGSFAIRLGRFCRGRLDSWQC